jgi:hypothetical protein
MREGWFGNEYVVIFDRSEVAAASERYEFHKALPGFTLLGLFNWDNFIVRDPKGVLCKVPTVPLDDKYLAEFELTVDDPTLQPDGRFVKKIKWYVTPLIFGGDPDANDNVTWVDHEKHAELVKSWNAKYREQSANDGDR